MMLALRRYLYVNLSRVMTVKLSVRQSASVSTVDTVWPMLDAETVSRFYVNLLWYAH